VVTNIKEVSHGTLWLAKEEKTDNADTTQIPRQNKIRFEYDAERQVLIKCSSEDLPKIIDKNNLVWRNFGPQDDSYARAIFLGQGCWERLDTITEAEAQRILAQWGYPFENN